MGSQKVKLAIALLGFAVAGVLLARYLLAPGDTTQTLREVAYYQCLEDGTQTELTLAEVARRSERGHAGLPCPKCSKPMLRMAKCYACGALNEPVGHGSRPENCSKCNARMDTPPP